MADRDLTASDLVDRLRAKYPANAYTVLEQVRDAAGFYAQRTGDVMVMGLWPSRGLELQGFEIKVSRADWLREVKKPEKAETLYAFCDRWWLLASAADVVQDMELPPTWGLAVATGRGIGVVKAAPKLDPRPIDRSLLAALLKRAWASRPETGMLDQARAEGRREGEARRSQAAEDLAKLQAELTAFETASGIAITRYTEGKELGEAVKLLAEGWDSPLKRLARVRRDVRDLADRLDIIAGAVDHPSHPAGDHDG